MHLSLACLAVFPIAALAYQPPWALERVVKRGAYSFDTFTGENMADSSANLPATKVVYTSAEGASYVLSHSRSLLLIVSYLSRLPNPFEAQRIGPTGPLLLQDVHLVRILSSLLLSFFIHTIF
jgi:hypothetical protein